LSAGSQNRPPNGIEVLQIKGFTAKQPYGITAIRPLGVTEYLFEEAEETLSPGLISPPSLRNSRREDGWAVADVDF
jgi:hypothetical protein